jgi:peptidoglycan/LPS O-acetylase OafA/YrhL
MTEKAGKSPNHWPLLDFLRATAALLVLFGHTRDPYFLYTDVLAQPGLMLKLFYFITDLHNEAVVIFFVLSGFLIGGSLADSVQLGSFDLVRYLIARFVRIYIVYLPTLVITEAVFLFGSRLLSDPGDISGRCLANNNWVSAGFRRRFAISPDCRASVAPVGSKILPCGRSVANGRCICLPRDHPTDRVEGFPGLRLMAIALVCAIAATVCQDPKQGVGWFIVWFLGVASYRVLRAGLVPLPVGLLGAGLIIAGMVLRHLKVAGMLQTDTIIAAGTAIAIACRPMVAFPLAPRLFGWAAGFSYTLYAIHLPLVYLIVAIFQNTGFPQDKVPPSPAAFMEFGVTIAICLLAAFLVSLVSERKTGQVRAAMMRRVNIPLKHHS